MPGGDRRPAPEYADPWTRIVLATQDPVADAVREDRLVWVDGLEELARRYPRAAAAQPYRFCMAAAPSSERTPAGVPCCCCGPPAVPRAPATAKARPHDACRPPHQRPAQGRR